MPRIYDPGYLDRVIKALGLREQAIGDLLDEGIQPVLELGRYLTTQFEQAPSPPFGWTGGTLSQLNLSAPAAGNDFTPVGPGAGFLWVVRAFVTTFATGAVVPARTVGLLVRTKGPVATMFAYDPNTHAPSNGGATISFIRGLPAAVLAAIAGSASDHAAPTGDLILKPGWTLSTITRNLTGGDSFGTATLIVEEFSLVDALGSQGSV